MPSPLEAATEWLREYANSYLPNGGKFKHSVAELESAGITVVDLVSLFRCGHVIAADISEGIYGPLGVWLVVGPDSYDCLIEARLAVDSKSMSIEVLDASRLITTEKASNGAE